MDRGGGGGGSHFIMQKSKVKVRGSDIHDPLGQGGGGGVTLSHSRRQCEGTIVVLSVCLSDLSHTSHTQTQSYTNRGNKFIRF